MTGHLHSRFRELPAIFFEEVEPTPLLKPRLAALSPLCEKMLQLNLSDSQWLQWLDGTERRDSDQRISSRYAGHQFGAWAGQLGDGRAISLAEVLLPNGESLEIQTKGSGLTPFSRMGDGKAVIRSSVREFLASEHMFALNVPTTRALALITGEDAVYRETVERSAIVARVFPSNIRFGHFEYAFHFQKPEALQALVDFTRHHYYPDCADHLSMLGQILERTALLMAKWQAIGFEHGVMNTDNMSILGLTIDYGPFGWMENYNPDWICNHTDHQGRYRFQNQPQIAMWNLDRLFWCFSDMIEPDRLKELLHTFDDRFNYHWQIEMNRKLGLKQIGVAQDDLVQDLLQVLQNESLDWTSSFRKLSASLPQAPTAWNKSKKLMAWHGRYVQMLIEQGSNLTALRHELLQINPKYVLRSSIAQKIIADVEKDDFKSLHEWLHILTHPFDEHPGFDLDAEGPRPGAPEVVLSCSS